MASFDASGLKRAVSLRHRVEGEILHAHLLGPDIDGWQADFVGTRLFIAGLRSAGGGSLAYWAGER